MKVEAHQNARFVQEAQSLPQLHPQPQNRTTKKHQQVHLLPYTPSDGPDQVSINFLVLREIRVEIDDDEDAKCN